MTNDCSEHDIRCSNSCTRAGITALVLGAVALSMLQPLTKTRALDALLQYVSLRGSLKNELDRLEIDPAWKSLKASDFGDKASKDWNLAQLLDYKVKLSFAPSSVPESQEETKRKSAVSPGPAKGPPAAPTGLSVTVERRLEPIHVVGDVLTRLGDGALLSRARNYSYRYDWSIYRWASLLYQLLVDSKSKEGVVMVPIPLRQKKQGSSVPNYSHDELLKYRLFA